MYLSLGERPVKRPVSTMMQPLSERGPSFCGGEG